MKKDIQSEPILLSDEQIKKYDQVIAFTLSQIYSLSHKETQTIYLKYNREDVHNRYILECCFMLTDFALQDLYLVGNFWKYLRLKRIYRKKRRIKFIRCHKVEKYLIKPISSTGLIVSICAENNIDLDDIENIYNNYYRRNE